MGYYIEAKLIRELMDKVLESVATFELKNVHDLFQEVMREQKYIEDKK